MELFVIYRIEYEHYINPHICTYDHHLDFLVYTLTFASTVADARLSDPLDFLFKAAVMLLVLSTFLSPTFTSCNLALSVTKSPLF